MTLNLEKTHATKVAADQLVNELANMVILEGITPLKALTLKAQEDAKQDDWQIFLSGSSFISGSTNPFHFLVNKFVKVFYGLNANLVLGSAYHKGLEYAGKAFIETGNPRFGKALASSIAYIDENFALIKTEERPEKKELYYEVARLLKAYWPELDKNRPVEVETFVQMPAPEYMLRDAANASKIYLTGAADTIYETKNGLVLSDHKTSKKPISGTAKKDEKTLRLEKEIKANKAALVKASKAMEKLSQSPQKLADAQRELGDISLKIVDAQEAGKATTQLKKRYEKWQKEVAKWKERVEKLKGAQAQAEELSKTIEQDEEILFELLKSFEEEKEKEDLLEAKRMHGQQLAFYAMLYMITTGKEIKRVRLENMVKATAKPYLQVFEWELDDMVLAKAEEQIRAAVTRIELMLEGIDPLVLFPLNPMSFIGSETNKLVADIEAVAELLRKEVIGDEESSLQGDAA